MGHFSVEIMRLPGQLSVEINSLSPSLIFIPLLFMAHGLPFAPQLLAGNLQELERHWLGFIVDHTIADMRKILTPVPGRDAGPGFQQVRA